MSQLSLFFLVTASRNIMKDPGIIVRPIAWILGQVINIFFTIIYKIGIHANSLGLAIILLTIFTRCLMIPLSYNQQKSMFKIQALSPELKRIQDKYKDGATDPEVQRKMQMEMQKLYSENKVSPFSGCLPMLIQLPIFFGLYYVMQNPFKYIDIINDVFTQISTMVLTAAQSNTSLVQLIREFGTYGHVPDGTKITIEVFNRIINILGPEEVARLKELIPSPEFSALCANKDAIEIFLGLNLTETSKLFPISTKTLIPVLSGVTTYLSSWIMTRKNKDMDPAMRTQQRIMNITMPLMMIWITSSLPGGIGIYWITSNIFQLFQQWFLNYYFEKKVNMEIVVPKEKKHRKGGKR